MEGFLQDAIVYLGTFGFVMIVVLGILHPITSNPWSFLTLSLSISVLGIGWGYTVLFISNVIGIFVLYALVHLIRRKSHDYFHKKKYSKKALEWVKETPSWKHMIVIGMPMVPTFIIKLAIPFTSISFKEYFITLLGSYLVLFFGNTLMYFGITSLISDTIPDYVSYIILVLFVLYIYFGKQIRDKWQIDKIYNEE